MISVVKTTFVAMLFAITPLCSCISATLKFEVSDLLGEWTGKAPDGSTLKYIFHKDGSVINFIDEAGFKASYGPSGLQAKYVIREKSPKWEIDIYDYKDARLKGIIFQGILQPIEKGKFKMQGMPSTVGARPSDFDDQAIIFTKTAA